MTLISKVIVAARAYFSLHCHRCAATIIACSFSIHVPLLLSTMITPSLKDLHDAIMTNSANVVENYLLQNQGVNPNANHASLLPVWNSVVDSSGNVHPNCVVATNGTIYDSISALHLAVIQCFQQHDEHSLQIFNTLVENGANISLTTNGIYLGLLENNNQWSLVVADNGMTPLQLAIFFKKYLGAGPFRQAQEYVLHQVTSALLHATTKPTTDNTTTTKGPLKIATHAVPASVFGTWKSLLTSSEFADVMFECIQDGSTFVAHKCVLSAASEYFRNYFHGPWSTHHPDNVWKTSNSSEVMWAILVSRLGCLVCVVSFSSNCCCLDV